MTSIYTAPLPGGKARQLTRPEDGAAYPAWTSDSREIIYSATEYQGPRALFRASAATGRAQRISDPAYGALEAQVALAGNRLAFTQHTEVYNLWRLDVDRPRSLRKIAPTTRLQHSPDFSPDGKSLLFISSRAGSRQLWTSGGNGENLVQVTANEAFRTVGRPRWSPDGSEIAFGAEPTLGGDRDVFLVGSRGGVPRPLLRSPAHDMLPSFSRDGRWIYFTSDRGGLFQVWKAPREGDAAVAVTKAAGLAPVESADGKCIYYWNGSDRSIWSVPSAGGAEAPVLSGINHFGWWTLAGNAIIYLVREDAGQQPRWLIRRFDPADRTTAVIAELSKRPPVGVGAVAATPDGRTIVYAQVDEDTTTIMLVENFR
jgi:Tol biopolymer transport system component